MILITYRLGSWKKALELNKVKHKPFYKWPQFRLERMQMTAEGEECVVWGKLWGWEVTHPQPGDPVDLDGESFRKW